MWSNQKGQSHELVNQRVYGGCNPTEIKGMTHDYLGMFFEDQKQILYEYLNCCNVLGEGGGQWTYREVVRSDMLGCGVVKELSLKNG